MTTRLIKNYGKIAGCASPTGMVTSGFLPSRDTRTSLYIVGEGREHMSMDGR